MRAGRLLLGKGVPPASLLVGERGSGEAGGEVGIGEHGSGIVRFGPRAIAVESCGLCRGFGGPLLLWLAEKIWPITASPPDVEQFGCDPLEEFRRTRKRAFQRVASVFGEYKC